MLKTIACVAFFAAASTLAVAACSSSSSGGNTQPTDGGGAEADIDIGDTGTPVGDAGLKPLNWGWQNIPGAKCRDGSDTGIAINLNPASTKVMIFLEGGGACFNSTTCQGNPSKYGETEFVATLKAAGAAGFNGSFDDTKTNGIMSRADDKNPVKDWNMIYIPYCTGDIHGGVNPAGMVPGVTGTQQFVGRKNMELDLAAIKALLPNTTEVLLTGMSGGGFGTVMSYDQVATFWGQIPVTMIDDSGPPMSAPYLAPCLQSQLVSLWGLEKGVLADCGADCTTDAGLDTGNFGINVMKHLGKKYPTRKFGLIESTGDVTITSFFGFGDNGACKGFAPVLEPDFINGLLDIRAQMAFTPNFGTFYFGGADHQKHTSYEGSLDERMSTDNLDGGTGPTALYEWTANMLKGTVTNVGP
jgi:hypothetical protein